MNSWPYRKRHRIDREVRRVLTPGHELAADFGIEFDLAGAGCGARRREGIEQTPSAAVEPRNHKALGHAVHEDRRAAEGVAQADQCARIVAGQYFDAFVARGRAGRVRGGGPKIGGGHAAIDESEDLIIGRGRKVLAGDAVDEYAGVGEPGDAGILDDVVRPVDLDEVAICLFCNVCGAPITIKKIGRLAPIIMRLRLRTR